MYIGSGWLAPSDWHALALVNKRTNHVCVNGDRRTAWFYRTALYNALKDQLKLYRPDDWYSASTEVYTKIFSKLKFYQVASFIELYDKTKGFGFRYFCMKWMRVCKISLDFSQICHGPTLLLASSYTPGKFWKILNDYAAHSLWQAHPENWDKLSPIEQKIAIRAQLCRGIPMNWKFLEEDEFLPSVQRFTKIYTTYPECKILMEGKWGSLNQVLWKYEKDLGCHFPVDCATVGCPWRSEGCDLSWLPSTEIYHNGDGDVHEDVIILKNK